SDRPVKLGELTDLASLNVTGYNPGDIAIKLRLPPDLFSPKDKGVPLNLKYRYTPQPTSTNSSLTISVNENFLKSTLL
ncbi:cellulose biosynthesis cyclic di-GMP-binding regulatory protein BcsB, partial [Roseateles sp. GG27B]